jgi:hypothetical protein
VTRVTRHYAKTKERSLRSKDQKIKQEHLDELAAERGEKKSERNQIKEAAFNVMEKAYLQTSGDGSLSAKPRQIMYVVRSLIAETIGEKVLDASYFTQILLPEYREKNPDQTRDWNITYDARGHFTEPHTEITFGIGTLEVREYLAAWKSGSTSTYGPENRFKNALFIEKEGFDALLEESKIAERFDLAILSTKGMSTTSARELVEALSNAGVTTFVAHDFDSSGFGIFYTLGHDTKRHEFRRKPKVIDIGLRLTDVKEMGLQSEPCPPLYQAKDPKIKLAEYGATDAELEFLIGERHRSENKVHWDGKRVELNAMTSPQMIAWLERKLLANGVEKLVPDADLLSPIWQNRQRVRAYDAFKITDGEQVRAIEVQLEEARAQLEKDFDAHYKPPRTPEDLREQVAEYLHLNTLVPWDTAIAEIAGNIIESR